LLVLLEVEHDLRPEPEPPEPEVPPDVPVPVDELEHADAKAAAEPTSAITTMKRDEAIQSSSRDRSGNLSHTPPFGRNSDSTAGGASLR